MGYLYDNGQLMSNEVNIRMEYFMEWVEYYNNGQLSHKPKWTFREKYLKVIITGIMDILKLSKDEYKDGLYVGVR